MTGEALASEPAIRFEVNHPAVVADIIDGEAVIMNLEKGDYYSLDLIGADIWRLIVAGHTVGEIAAAIADRYGIARQQAEADVGALSMRLVSESLILAADGGGAATRPIPAAELAAPAYQAPHLHVYADMKDLLALDPPLPEFKRSPGS